ncbi:Two-component system sensor histidine kinase [Tenacibaculum litopenaei]|uniref:sensor histidine kinase n=1 Tax=Tenacibaculum litopenaei TaxID=396016 RepID=UPI00389358E1
MKRSRFNWILYFISATILVTIGVQLYWNFKNYQQNKQYVVTEIQESLNKSIEEYFASLTKENFFAIVEPKSRVSSDKRQTVFDSIMATIKDDIIPKKLGNKKKKFEVSAIEFGASSDDDFQKMDSVFFDSIVKEARTLSKKLPVHTDLEHHLEIAPEKVSEIRVYSGQKSVDSLKFIKGLQTVYISIKNETINHQKLDSLLQNELRKKGIASDYYLEHHKGEKQIYIGAKDSTKVYPIQTTARSTYLKPDETIALFAVNPTKEALKRSSTGILLSLAFSLAIIASLFYLLRVINQQKELAEIKNDLISNITHEFKTPITTVSTAIEAIDQFNIIDDKEKTKKFLALSAVQLKKLHQMVEKLLETATLDSEKLLLKKEPTDLVELAEKTVQKHVLISREKSIKFTTNSDTYQTNLDAFHFENALSNLIDNAVKYGGNQIEVHLHQVLSQVEISVVDNGSGIDKHQQERIFDKFYRVPKGNTHDVKGFGIGLYYTKKIVEKHGGTLSLTSNPQQTTFKINL